jgi:hypothetical protein
MIRDSAINSFGGSGTSSSFLSEFGESEIEGTQSTSTNFILEMGTLDLGTAEFKTQNWRWYDDEEHETPSSALAGENTAPADIEDQAVVKLRIAVAETAGFGMEGAKFALQYSTSSNFSTGGYVVAESWSCDGSSWCYADGAGADTALISSSTLSDVDACVSSFGAGCGTHNESATSTSAEAHEASAIAEYEFTIRQSGAAINTVYFFRLVETVGSTTVALNTGETYPSLVSGGASLLFTISGLSLGASTEGITTDIATTPTLIAFGTLPENAQVEGAQRVAVTTNGTGGYRVFLFQRQDFLSETSQKIDPVTGTNATPAPWGTGCTVGAFSCFGYHSGDDVLDGGIEATRFAANDTYAQSTSTPETIAYHGASASDQTTDIVYRVEARTGQDNGEYSTSLVYIVTPVF